MLVLIKFVGTFCLNEQIAIQHDASKCLEKIILTPTGSWLPAKTTFIVVKESQLIALIELSSQTENGD